MMASADFKGTIAADTKVKQRQFASLRCGADRPGLRKQASFFVNLK